MPVLLIVVAEIEIDCEAPVDWIVVWLFNVVKLKNCALPVPVNARFAGSVSTAVPLLLKIRLLTPVPSKEIVPGPLMV